MPHPLHVVRPRALETHRREVGAASSLSCSIPPPTHAQNVNLDQHIASQWLSFIDVLGQLRGEATLRPLYDVVQAYLQAAVADESHTLVILDTVSPLEWIGYSTTELFRFLRALAALCRKVRSAMPFSTAYSRCRTEQCRPRYPTPYYHPWRSG